MVMKAATLYDAGEPCGAEANAGKYVAAEAAFQSCQTAIATLGGRGYAKEYHVERYADDVIVVCGTYTDVHAGSARTTDRTGS